MKVDLSPNTTIQSQYHLLATKHSAILPNLRSDYNQG